MAADVNLDIDINKKGDGDKEAAAGPHDIDKTNWGDDVRPVADVGTWDSSSWF